MTELLDEILLIGIEAWRRWPGAADVGARRDHIKVLMENDVTWAVLEKCYPQALALGITWLLNEARQKMDKDAGRPAGGAGLAKGDIPQPAARVTEDQASGPGSEPTKEGTTAGAEASAAPNQRDRDRIAAIIRVEARLSRLDTVFVGNKKIGDCTVAEVRAWARQRGDDAAYALRDRRFALSLVSNLPGGEIVRNWVSDKDADEQYEKAEREYIDEA